MRFVLPTKKQVVTWALRVLGVLVLGALANGVWQSWLGPAIHFSTRWVLDIASLGLASYKNGVYKQIAADDQSVAPYNAYLAGTLIFVTMIATAAVYTFHLSSVNRRQAERASRAPSGAPPNPEPQIADDALNRRLLKAARRQRFLAYLFSIYVGLSVASQLISVSRVSYETSAQAHYHQVLRIVSPYLEPREQTQVESDFAQIGSREDYVRLLSRLESQCKAHDRTVPKFDPW